MNDNYWLYAGLILLCAFGFLYLVHLCARLAFKAYFTAKREYEKERKHGDQT